MTGSLPLRDQNEGEHLWEVDHPYYCSESNYYVGRLPRWASPLNIAPPLHYRAQALRDHAPGDHMRFDSWAEFGWKDADPDYNLLFRWDWDVPDPADYDGDEGDDLPEERLNLFWMLQRKGRFMVTSFPVQREDEPEIRAWLQERGSHLARVWEPIALSVPMAFVEKQPGENDG